MRRGGQSRRSRSHVGASRIKRDVRPAIPRSAAMTPATITITGKGRISVGKDLEAVKFSDWIASTRPSSDSAATVNCDAIRLISRTFRSARVIILRERRRCIKPAAPGRTTRFVRFRQSQDALNCSFATSSEEPGSLKST
jgi:hypothetical protein